GNDDTVKLGIVVLGDYRDFNQHLEDEINRHFKVAKITEIITVGNQGGEYVLHFARKNNIPYTVRTDNLPFTGKKKGYGFDDSDNFRYPVYETDALLLFNNDERNNPLVWLILCYAKMTREDFVFINDVTTTPDYSREEREVMDLTASLAGEFSDYEMRELFFKLNRPHLKTFVKYMQTGEKMDRKRILFRLSELYIKGEKYNREVADIPPDRNEYFWIARSLIKNVLAFQTGEKEIGENYAEIMKAEINPAFPDDRVFADFIIRLSSLMRDPWLDLDYCMHILLSEYRDDEEMCAAVCYGEWLCFKAAHSLH
ncbi:MAG: hypothetical protein LBC48_01210, partial [Dysgonamonadaceae bacterium]|nr:hypothetical protein [Dysgonamonadaceae bacterium]